MIMRYWNYITRPLPQGAIPSGIETVPDFVVNTTICSIFFIVIMILIPLFFGKYYPKWYATLNDRKKGEFPSYLSSMLHHFTVVPLSWLYIYKDAFLVTDYNSPLDYTSFLHFAAPVCTGFVIADTIFYAIPLMSRGNFEYIIHHILAFGLIYVFLYGPGNMTRFFPHIIICDTTNVLFNSAWLLRLTGYKDSIIVSTFEILFAVFFVLIRGINMTIVFGIIFQSDAAKAFGPFRYVFPMISALQFYWLYKIVQGLFAKFGGGKKVAVEGSKGSEEKMKKTK